MTFPRARELLQKAYVGSVTTVTAELPYATPLPAPYLPPLDDEDTYTCVLDLDETLVHYFEGEGDGDQGYFLVRPGCHEFLISLS